MTKRVKLTMVIVAAGLLLPLSMLRPAAVADKALTSAPAVPLNNGLIVVVDAGHGSKDTGVVGIGGIREKDINLAIALKLRDILTKNGAKVIMTRTDDSFLPLMARPALVKPNRAQYFVSIHCGNDWPASSASGVLVYYHGQSLAGKLFAKNILAGMQRASAMSAYGVRSDTSRFRLGFGVLRGSPVPSVLVECGFLNDAKDAAPLVQPETQQKIADGIAAGLDSVRLLQPKIDYVNAVHAHNQRLIEFWDSFARQNAVYEQAIRQHEPHLLASILSSQYTNNGHPVSQKLAVNMLEAKIEKYGTRHHDMKYINVSPNKGYERIVAKSSENWGPIKPGADKVTLSRRDVWTKMPTGWQLAETDVK